MALRIKCTCGKSLKISSQLADKKLLCPGCKKAFRIPAEKFRKAESAASAAAAKAPPAPAKKAPPVAKPKAEAPLPAPVELDLLPEKIDWSSGDLSVSQSDILSDIIPDAKPTAASPSGKLGLTCPLCRKKLPVGSVICLDCGFNASTRTYIKTSLADDIRANEAEGRTGKKRSASSKRGFWARLRGIFQPAPKSG
ncbi:MAG TPA: hypothetical protein VMV94_14800 [Phycisphaerae bacterium]|nr:hypothetical protein [Phycisphaerae bacterium]